VRFSLPGLIQWQWGRVRGLVQGEGGRWPGEGKAERSHVYRCFFDTSQSPSSTVTWPPGFPTAFKIQSGLLAKMTLRLAAVGMVSKLPKPTSVK